MSKNSKKHHFFTFVTFFHAQNTTAKYKSRCRRASFSIDVLRGQHTELVLEAFGKITRRGEAHTLGQLVDGHRGVFAQGLGGLLQANVSDEFLRGLACRWIDFAVEACATQAHVGAELVDAIVGVGEVLFNALDGTTQEVVVDAFGILVGFRLYLNFVKHKLLV